MKKGILTAISVVIFAVVGAFLELSFIGIQVGFLRKFLFLFLLNLNIAGLLIIIFFVGRSIRRLYLERKHGIPGHKFKTKMVLFFGILTSIPSVLLFLTAGGLGTNYIERLFTPIMKKPLDEIIEVVKSVYEMERKRAIRYAEQAGEGILLPPDIKVSHLKSLSPEEGDTVKSAFMGLKGGEVISRDGKDIVRGAVLKGDEVVLIEYPLPSEITERLKKIKEVYEDYIQISALNLPMKINFILILGFSALMIIFLSLWVSMRIAGRITEPVKNLVTATESVAGGDLSVSVKTESKDEIGLLIKSFNRMVVELAQGKRSLENAYTESHRRRLFLENILSSIRSGVIFLGVNGEIVTINPPALKILGLKADEVIGKHYSSILRGIESEELKAFIKSINLKTFNLIEKELRAVVSKREVILRVFITGLKDFSGAHMGLLVVFDDITNLIKAQRALAWQEMAMRIAHEIKNPLTPIRLSTERMLKKWQEKDQDFSSIFERSVGTIIKEVDSLRSLVDEFARFGKMPEISKKPTELMSIVEEVMSLYKAYKGLHLALHGENVNIELDPEQFKRVLINLFDNAVSAMAEKGDITISIRPEYALKKVFIEVADRGPGIKDSDKERLFLPYFSTKKHGTGLGLAIADRIIAGHGGSISVSENKPHGSVFTIELPISYEEGLDV